MKLIKTISLLSLFFINNVPAMNIKSVTPAMDTSYKTDLQKSLKSFEAYIAELSTLEQKDNATLEAMAVTNITLRRLKLVASNDIRAAVTTEKNVSIVLVRSLKNELN